MPAPSVGCRAGCLPPSGLTASMPEISLRNSLRMAGPLAASSTNTVDRKLAAAVQLADGGQRGGEVDSGINLVGKVEIGLAGGPQLTRDVVAGSGVLESTVPGRNHVVELAIAASSPRR